METLDTFKDKVKVDLFSDLDNTIIYSHRVQLPADKVAVENLDGKEQSFMTLKTYEYFRTTSWFRIIPVTTRSAIQYRRIFVLGDVISCKYCLACNGGELLVDGEADDQWMSETMNKVGNEIGEVVKAFQLLKSVLPTDHVYMPSGIMAYASCDNPLHLSKWLKSELNLAQIQVLQDKRKVYCIPRSVNKGEAVKRFRRRFGRRASIGAGDSLFDVPLLNSVDFAVAPMRLEPHLTNKKRMLISEDKLLSDELCQVMENLKAGILL